VPKIIVIKAIMHDKYKNAFSHINVKSLEITREMNGAYEVEPNSILDGSRTIPKSKVDYSHDYSRTIATLDEAKIKEHCQTLFLNAKKYGQERIDKLVDEKTVIENGLKALEIQYDDFLAEKFLYTFAVYCGIIKAVPNKGLLFYRKGGESR
jgi:hypothetical protein